MANSPYKGLDARAYWRKGVTEAHMARAASMDLYRRKFDISPEDVIVTAGSCFAQHIARNMRAWGFNVFDAEPAPIGLPPELHAKYGFGLYSARHGNIYTTRQLLQLYRESLGRFEPQNWIWEKNGRFYDALRPSVTPNGLESPDMVRAARATHLKRFRKAMTTSNLIVFTLGLTETWEDKASGTVFPTAPGTIAGDYDPDQFAFRNLTHAEVLADFLEFRRLVKRFNPDARFLVTVSPVPLTATAADAHVMVATSYSKSVLRAVTGELYDAYDDIDYFPSYEIITTPAARGFFYEPNLREVTPEGVEIAMATFKAEHGQALANVAPKKGSNKQKSADDIVCEEVLLEAFAQ
jgi:hypothetical protein